MASAKIVIEAAVIDYITCPGCRTCVGRGRTCICPMRTQGPRVEGLLQRLVNGRLRAPAKPRTSKET